MLEYLVFMALPIVGILTHLIASYKIAKQKLDDLWLSNIEYYKHPTYVPDGRYSFRLTQSLCFHRHLTPLFLFKRICIQCGKIDWIWRMRTIR